MAEREIEALRKLVDATVRVIERPRETVQPVEGEEEVKRGERRPDERAS